MLTTPEFWVFASLILFLALLVHYKIPGKLGKALDHRAEAISHELDEARRLREEAQAILADYQRKQRDAEQEAAAIIAMARKEAQFYADETRRSLNEALARRVKIAEDKIARAEAQALEDVRAKSVDVAVAAAQKLIAKKLTGKSAQILVDRSIDDLKTKLN